MKKYFFLVLLLFSSTLSLGAPPTTIPITIPTTTTTYCWSNYQCEDNNACTYDYCFMGFCLNDPYSQTPCDDGLYCNGDDVCGDHDGLCSVHSGDPCPAGTVCNEDTDLCDSIPATSTTTSIGQTTTSTSIIGGTTTTSTNQATTSTSTVGGSLSISGYGMGAIVEDVTILLGGTASATSITDTDGYYEFINLASGFYTIKPDKDGYSFEPPNYVIPNLTSVLVEMNFEATKTRCLVKAIYGEDSEEDEQLRYFRDNILAKTPEGQEIIRLYYEWSPAIVRAMEEDEAFKEEVKEMIDGVLELIREEIK